MNVQMKYSTNSTCPRWVDYLPYITSQYYMSFCWTTNSIVLVVNLTLDELGPEDYEACLFHYT